MNKVYEISVEDKFYNGVTANPKYRFRPSAYRKEKELYELIVKYGWKFIKAQIKIVAEFEDRLEALKLEGELINKHKAEGNSLNQYKSGLEYKEDEQLYRKLWMREWRKKQTDNN